MSFQAVVWQNHKNESIQLVPYTYLKKKVKQYLWTYKNVSPNLLKIFCFSFQIPFTNHLNMALKNVSHHGFMSLMRTNDI